MKSMDTFHKGKAISFSKFIGRQYMLLNEIMENLNVCYSFQVQIYRQITLQQIFTFTILSQIMMIVAAVFIFSTSTLYTFYQYMIDQNEYSEITFYLHLIAMISYSLHLFAIMHMGSVIKLKVIFFYYDFKTQFITFQSIFQQGKKTFEIVHKIINSSQNSDVNESVRLKYIFIVHLIYYVFMSTIQLFQLSQQIQSRYPVASCGLFTFDWTLLYSVREFKTKI